jgi:hypothetical protein
MLPLKGNTIRGVRLQFCYKRFMKNNFLKNKTGKKNPQIQEKKKRKRKLQLFWPGWFKEEGVCVERTQSDQLAPSFNRACIPRWRVKCPLCENRFPHPEHLKGRSPVWVRRCLAKEPESMKPLAHSSYSQT